MRSASTTAEQQRNQGAVASATKPTEFWRSDLFKAAAVLLILVWFPLVTLSDPVTDPDIWWHMRTGEWIVRQHQFPRTDPFSVTGAGKSWVAYSWSFGVLAYWIGKYWDLLGLTALRIVLWLAATWAFFHLMRKVAPQFWRAAALTGVGSVVMYRAFGPRPGLFTVLFFVLELTILWEADRSGRTASLWLLPPLFCAWANVHVQFVYGLFVLGLFCIDPFLSRWLVYRREEVAEGRIPNRLLWLILAFCTAATFLNPYGWGVHRVVMEYARQSSYLTKNITEMSPLRFDRLGDYLAVLLAVGASFALRRDKRIRPVWVLLLAWAAISALRSQRDIWVLTIVSCVLIGERVCSGGGEMVALDRRARLAAIAGTLAVLLFAWQSFAPTNKQLLSYVAGRLPLGSIAYIHEHHLRGPIFNNFDWGGFLIYALPEERVAIDGRTNVHDEDELQRSFRTWNGMPGWTSDPLLARANLVIASPDFALTQLLRADPRFKAVFEDGGSVLFQRVIPDTYGHER